MKNRKRIYKTYKRGEVVYADLGKQPQGVQGGVRPCVVVSSDASNHYRAPQVTVCPLSSKLKDKIVHVKIMPLDVDGYHLSTESDLLAEDITTIAKETIRGSVGMIDTNSELMRKIDKAMMLHLGIEKYHKNNDGEAYEHEA